MGLLAYLIPSLQLFIRMHMYANVYIIPFINRSLWRSVLIKLGFVLYQTSIFAIPIGKLFPYINLLIATHCLSISAWTIIMGHIHSFVSVYTSESKKEINAYNRVANTLLVRTLMLDQARNMSTSSHILRKHGSLWASNFSRASIPSYQPRF